MSTDRKFDPPADCTGKAPADEHDRSAESSDAQRDVDFEFAGTEDREQTDASFREKGREIMKRFRDAFASLAE